jgi:hypothetical protein
VGDAELEGRDVGTDHCGDEVRALCAPLTKPGAVALNS